MRAILPILAEGRPGNMAGETVHDLRVSIPGTGGGVEWGKNGGIVEGQVRERVARGNGVPPFERRRGWILIVKHMLSSVTI